MKDAAYQQAKERIELAAYFAKQMIEELGRDRALKIIENAYRKYSTNRFAAPYQDMPPDQRFPAFLKHMHAEAERDQSFTIVEESDKHIKVRFHRCATFEAFNDFGLAEVCQKYCDADFIAFPELHPKMKITRDHEIAYGDDFCDHCWSLGE